MCNNLGSPNCESPMNIVCKQATENSHNLTILDFNSMYEKFSYILYNSIRPYCDDNS